MYTETPSEGAEIETQDRRQDKVGYWLKWLPMARKSAEMFIRDADAAWREYEKKQEQEDRPFNQTHIANCYPIYWGRCQTLEPAFYSRTPEITTETLFNINDDIARTGSLIIERLGNYFERTTTFDEIMQECVSDFVHAGRTTTQVYYETALTSKKSKIPLYQQGDSYLSESGVPFEGEVFQDPQTGNFFGELLENEVNEESQKIHLKSVAYDEILHTPNAKSSSEIKEIAYYFCFNRHEAKEMFGEEVIENIPFKKKKDKREQDYGETRGESPDEYLDGYEIWCKDTKTVYWVSECYPFSFLKEPKPDPYELEGFFPSPAFAIQSKPRKSLYPTPPYIHLRPTIQQLHLMYQRVFGLIDSVRRRAIVDGEEDVISALLLGDQEFVSAKSFKNIVEKGGLQNMIWYLPVQELVQAISELNALEDRFKANFDEWFGTPDIIQGTSDPIESLGAQEIKATSAHDRFKNSKKKLQELARKSLEMMIDLALKVYSDQRIANIVGYAYMDQEDQMRFLDALSMLRNDEQRIVRVVIETDSMTFVDKGLKQQKLNVAIQSAINGLQQVSSMLQISPDYANVALQTVLLSLDGIDAGKKFQDGVKRAVAKLLELQQQPKETPPDINMLKLQIEQQKLSQQEQKLQIDAQIQSRELDRKEYEVALKDRDNQVSNQLEQYKIDIEATLNERIQAFIEWTEAQRLQIDKIKLGLDEKEKFLEEARLKSQQEVEALRATMEAMNQKAEPPKIPPINIHVDTSKSGKKLGKFINDELGNPMVIMEEIKEDNNV